MRRCTVPGGLPALQLGQLVRLQRQLPWDPWTRLENAAARRSETRRPWWPLLCGHDRSCGMQRPSMSRGLHTVSLVAVVALHCLVRGGRRATAEARDPARRQRWKAVHRADRDGCVQRGSVPGALRSFRPDCVVGVQPKLRRWLPFSHTQRDASCIARRISVPAIVANAHLQRESVPQRLRNVAARCMGPLYGVVRLGHAVEAPQDHRCACAWW